MKRTIAPEERRKIFQENITLNIKEENSCLKVEVELKLEENYPDNAQIFLEAYNRINIERIDLGKIEDHKQEKKIYDLPFKTAIRPKINFRLKIIDPYTYKILGLAENLKEQKYASSIIILDTTDKSVENIYKMNFYNLDYPILCLNPKLISCVNKLKPIIAEMALKEILTYLLFNDIDDIDVEDNKFFNFANSLIKYDNEYKETNDKKLEWINKVLCKFSADNKVINSIKKDFDK